MKILNILILAVIAGILDSTIADEDFPDRKQIVPGYLRGYYNTTIADIEKYEMQLCEKNGGPGAHDDHKKSRDDFQACLNILNTEMRQVVKPDAVISIHEMESLYYRTSCTMIPRFEACLKNLTDSMKTCIDPSKHVSVDIVFNVINSVQRLLCKNDAASISTFINGDGMECVGARHVALERCANQTFISYIKSVVSDGAQLGPLGALSLLVPDNNTCTIVEKFHDCSVKELRTCPNPMTADIADSVLNEIKKVSTCDRLLKSHASSSNVVNVLLTAAITVVMSLRFL